MPPTTVALAESGRISEAVIQDGLADAPQETTRLPDKECQRCFWQAGARRLGVLGLFSAHSQNLAVMGRQLSSFTGLRYCIASRCVMATGTLDNRRFAEVPAGRAAWPHARRVSSRAGQSFL